MIKPELYKRLDIFIKTYNFNITQEKDGYLRLDDGQPTTSLKSVNFLENSLICNRQTITYGRFTELLKKEVDGWSNEIFLNAYEYTSNTDLNTILISTQNVMRYLTAPETQDKITKKTLKNYSKMIRNEEEFIVYFKKVVSHPYWKDKEDFLKKYLVDNKKIKALNSLYPDAGQSEVELLLSCSAEVSIFTVNLNLLPNNHEGANYQNNKTSALSGYCGKLISDFNSCGYSGSPIKALMINDDTPADGKKEITVIGSDKYINLAFIELFFERLKLDLKEKVYVSEKNNTFVDEETIKYFMKEVATLGMKKKLEQNLESGKIIKNRKI